jgi:predicted ATP-grasp superfamily ATP-dependent carboligase
VNVRDLPPALILGGSANALSLVRSLGWRGVRVAVSVTRGNHALYSRYCAQRLPVPDSRRVHDFWRELLLGQAGRTLEGSVLLPCNDDAVEFVARNRAALQRRWLLDDSDPAIQIAMLDKQRTLELACRRGIDIPRFWPVSADASPEIPADVLFPVIVKPRQSHQFQKLFNGRKYLRAGDHAELEAQIERLRGAGLGAIVSEYIPGPDRLLASYYTYLDRNGHPLFHFTKRIIRRFPANEGLACYHATTRDPEMAELGLRFFQSIGFRGLGNVEFKKDERDGRWKLIECNPRFTAAQELITRCGLDIGWLVYRHIAGLSLPSTNGYREDVRLWYPVRDFLAFRQLRRQNEMTFAQWLRSVCRPQTLPYLNLGDPIPSLAPVLETLRRGLASRGA